MAIEYDLLSKIYLRLLLISDEKNRKAFMALNLGNLILKKKSGIFTHYKLQERFKVITACWECNGET